MMPLTDGGLQYLLATWMERMAGMKERWEKKWWMNTGDVDSYKEQRGINRTFGIRGSLSPLMHATFCVPCGYWHSILTWHDGGGLTPRSGVQSQLEMQLP